MHVSAKHKRPPPYEYRQATVSRRIGQAEVDRALAEIPIRTVSEPTLTLIGRPMFQDIVPSVIERYVQDWHDLHAVEAGKLGDDMTPAFLRQRWAWRRVSSRLRLPPL